MRVDRLTRGRLGPSGPSRPALTEPDLGLPETGHDGRTEVEMFTSIVVPLDLEPEGDRALPAAGALAFHAGIPVEFVTVSSPGMPELADICELSERAREIRAKCTTTVLHDNDVVGALMSFLVERPAALVAMATRARGVFGEHLLGGVTESLLARADRPVLLVGPSARITNPPASPTLVAGVNATTIAEALLPAIEAWIDSFGGLPPRLVEVLPVDRQGGGPGENDESGNLQTLATNLKDQGVEARWHVAHAKRPEIALIEFADRLVDAVIAVASVRWTDPGHSHLASVARRLAQHAHHPVLVLPAD